MTTKSLIIPAAGSGSRMQREVPKPYLKLAGDSILEHTVRRFLSVDGLAQVVIATSQEYLDQANDMLEKVLPDTVAARCVAGGNERQDSIRNALAVLSDVDLVMIHDAVRPFVEAKHIAECCRVASEAGAAVLGVPAKDTIKRVDGRRYVEETPTRKFLWQAQTPQVFRTKVILEAFEKAEEDSFSGTDDASLVEYLGRKVRMVEGSRSNFKITYPLDLKLARLLIEKE
ncbi:2-C-methyl-D-erythritol 4-phosphate cytidylyltransferase [Fodinibius halophilus]|uniref:2-C-methyl-D-erythritol 4-phosphate cytidylyltransferase n=1 Tax=Fodinibius halophilus TaxID=1736908 RepID=A0A6M1T0M2_9BACT|nr:2-C-methyl-D-erythritol 4-phosphate cytidylyltransferase [Fodinibius halophilus]